MDEETLSEILDVPTAGLKTVEGTSSPDFTKFIIKKQAVMLGKTLQLEYQLLFELMNKVLFPRTERRSITFIGDLVLLEARDSFSSISLLDIMIEHVLKVADFNDGNLVFPMAFSLLESLNTLRFLWENHLWELQSKCSP